MNSFTLPDPSNSSALPQPPPVFLISIFPYFSVLGIHAWGWAKVFMNGGLSDVRGHENSLLFQCLMVFFFLMSRTQQLQLVCWCLGKQSHCCCLFGCECCTPPSDVCVAPKFDLSPTAKLLYCHTQYKYQLFFPLLWTFHFLTAPLSSPSPHPCVPNYFFPSSHHHSISQLSLYLLLGSLPPTKPLYPWAYLLVPSPIKTGCCFEHKI